jgi:hypothetical protein
MRTNKLLTVALLVAAGVSTAIANDPQTPTPEQIAKAMEEVSQPGAEHEKLQPLIGKWNYTCKFWMDPSQQPMESSGTIERRWILGNRFLEEKIEGTGFDGKPGFEGLGLIGYDNAQKKYTTNWMCSMGTGTCSGVGDADSSGGFTFHTESFCPMMKKTINGRESLRFESDDKTVSESFVIEDGKETKIMEIIAVRQK